MLDELKNLDVDWSSQKTIELIDNAITLIKTGKAGGTQDELYSVIKQKVTESEEYYEEPLGSVDLYKNLAEIAGNLKDDKTRAHANKQVGIYKATNLAFLGYREAFFGNNSKAVEYYEEALGLYPEYELAQKDLEKAQKRVDRSTNDLSKLEDKADTKGDKKSILTLGLAYLDLGKIDTAMGCFNKILSEDGDDIDGLVRLGTSLACKGDLKESLSCFEKVLELQPKSMVGRRGKNYVSYMLTEGDSM